MSQSITLELTNDRVSIEIRKDNLNADGLGYFRLMKALQILTDEEHTPPGVIYAVKQKLTPEELKKRHQEQIALINERRRKRKEDEIIQKGLDMPKPKNYQDVNSAWKDGDNVPVKDDGEHYAAD